MTEKESVAAMRGTNANLTHRESRIIRLPVCLIGSVFCCVVHGGAVFSVNIITTSLTKQPRKDGVTT